MAYGSRCWKLFENRESGIHNREIRALHCRVTFSPHRFDLLLLFTFFYFIVFSCIFSRHQQSWCTFLFFFTYVAIHCDETVIRHTMGVRELTPAQLEFFEACRRGDVEKIRNCITSKKSKKPRTPLNFLRTALPSLGWLASSKDPSTLYTPLHTAALHGHYQVCKILLESDKLLCSARDKRGCIPLHLASWNGHYEAVKLLCESDPSSVDAVNNAQESSLHLAAQHGHDLLVRVLLEHHADPRIRNARFETPLDVAARTGHAVVCKILVAFCPELTLQSAVDCSSTGESGQIRAPVVYPLHAAARHSHIQCLQILRLGGFDIDFVTDEGSALHVAAMFGQVEAVKYLTNEGINPHVRDSKGRTALELLREHEQHRTSDLTHIIQSREGWSECRQIIEGYIKRLESDHFNSSSDSGIDRRDSERSVVDDDAGCDVWRPLPSGALADYMVKPSSRAFNSMPSSNRSNPAEIMVSVDAVCGAPSMSSQPECGAPLSDTTPTFTWSHAHVAPHRTWNSRMYDAERGYCLARLGTDKARIAFEQALELQNDNIPEFNDCWICPTTSYILRQPAVIGLCFSNKLRRQSSIKAKSQ
ncbi:unnamed protein product [Cylicocyclus nassatus]|uniref:Uncharacterized protein n=1 Tax=Cylicocyclus nassatus TaxID=53992 RepID=A0AA36MHD7_CYLNA|nr:unnamed protein product [Cylicocyclus nassatus]